jgi:hypothetical protein
VRHALVGARTAENTNEYSIRSLSRGRFDVNVVNVVVTCTKDKRVPVPEECQLRTVFGKTIPDRMREWQTRTNRHWTQSVPAKDLYAGDHWANVKAFESSHFQIDVWICSAGFGLVRYDDKIAPYAATFSRSHPDSVAAMLPDSDRSDASKKWWEATENQWKTRFKQRPRSISALMATYPKRSILVVASENYLAAIADDLRLGLNWLADPNQLSIVCAGAKSVTGLDANLVPCDARMQATTGGARRSLNTRLARKILKESRHPPTASNLQKRYRKLLEEQPPIETFDRVPLTDHQVKQFIRKQLKANHLYRHTPLLRMLRDDNKACEQKRFAMLYNEVLGERNG